MPDRDRHQVAEYRDSRRLTDAKIATLEPWIKQGSPQGDATKLPTTPKFPEDWHLGTLDLVVEMSQGTPFRHLIRMCLAI